MKKRITSYSILFILIFFAFSNIDATQRGLSVTVKSGKEISLYNDYHALVVGVSDYEKWPSLPNAVKDAREVSDKLKEMGFNVKTVLNPNSSELKKALSELTYRLGREKNRALLFYYAGHGETEKLADNTKLGYIIPSDCPVLMNDPSGFISKAVSMKEIESYSLRIRSKHVLMLFDSCFSGSLFSLTREMPEDISEKSSLPVRQYITAGTESETVPDKSMFKRCLLVGLEGDADLTHDGYITGTELGLYLSDKVVQASSRSQHPQYGKIRAPELSRGDFVIKLLNGNTVLKKSGPDTIKKTSKGSLYVDTKPEGAKIYIDESYKGMSPVNLTMLSASRISVKATKNGYNDQKETVFIREGRDTKLTLQLFPIVTKGGNIKVTSKPSGAKWYIDGAYAGTTPDEMRNLEEGKYRIDIKKDGYGKYSQSVQVKAGRQANLAINLKTIQTVSSGSKKVEEWIDPITGMVFMWIPSGCYEMGSSDGKKNEKPVHDVCVDGYWIGKYEVTQGEWKVVMGNNPSFFKKEDNYPVEGVSWYDIKKFIKKLRSLHRKKFKYRLPTEAEWEYAALGRDKRNKYAGEIDIKNIAWYRDNSDMSTHLVGLKAPNSHGIYDMIGNVWEWCEDIYSADAYEKHDRNNPLYNEKGSVRVIRGGSWYSPALYCRPAIRLMFDSNDRSDVIGFRVVREN